MLVDVTQRPQRLTLVQWTGDNTQEVADYVGALTGTYGYAEFVADSADSGRIMFTYSWQTVPDKPVTVGEWLHGTSDHYGPFVNVYSPAELNARFYPYPDIGPVDSNGATV